MTRVQKGLFGAALAAAITFTVSLLFVPYQGHFVIKAVPAVALSILVLTSVPGLPGRLLFMAFLFCAAGDVALALEGGRFFVIGLVFFLIAQMLFIVAFSRSLMMRRSRLPVIISLVIYGGVMALVLKPSLGELLIPVFFYMAVITAMGVLAALRAADSRVVLYGALLFIISDSLIAINRFTVAIPASDYLVMTTYYLALLLISYGYVRDQRAEING
jgi:uncharacterized membrane protein YhhN